VYLTIQAPNENRLLRGTTAALFFVRVIQEIDELLRRRPDLSSLADEAEVLQARLPEERGPSVPGGSALTCAELRLLPMLATHLTFPQIAATMSLSPNSIKSQAYSLYRKLGVSSRTEAVVRSRQRALLKRNG
jgi:LuxR family maltose regulon positive regulatory protein